MVLTQKSPEGMPYVSNLFTKELCNHGTSVMEGMLETEASKLFSLQPMKLKPKEIPLRSHG